MLAAPSPEPGRSAAGGNPVEWPVPHLLGNDPWRAREAIFLPTLPREVLDKAFALTTCLKDVWSGVLRPRAERETLLTTFVTRTRSERWLQTARILREEQLVCVDDSQWEQVLCVAAVLSSRRCPVGVGYLSGIPQGFLEGESLDVVLRQAICLRFVLGQQQVRTVTDLLSESRKTLSRHCQNLGVDILRNSPSIRALLEIAYPGVTRGQAGLVVADPPVLWWMLEDENVWTNSESWEELGFASAWVLRYAAKTLIEDGNSLAVVAEGSRTWSDLAEHYRVFRLLGAVDRVPGVANIEGLVACGLRYLGREDLIGSLARS